MRSAIKNSGYTFPGGARITVNLAPADLKKKGPIYDLAIALGIIANKIKLDDVILSQSIILGELALDGKVRSIHGVLSAAILAQKTNIQYVFIPYENREEASVIPDIKVIPIRHISEAVDILSKTKNIESFIYQSEFNTEECQQNIVVDFADIHGQEHAKRALMLAAAGGHNIIMQ